MQSRKISTTAPPAVFFSGGRADDVGPAGERGYGSTVRACANECAVLRVDRSKGAHVDGADRDDERVHVPRLYVDGRVRGARSNAAILQKSLAKARARKKAMVLRQAE